MGHLEGNLRPSYIWDARFLKVNMDQLFVMKKPVTILFFKFCVFNTMKALRVSIKGPYLDTSEGFYTFRYAEKKNSRERPTESRP